MPLLGRNEKKKHCLEIASQKKEKKEIWEIAVRGERERKERKGERERSKDRLERKSVFFLLRSRIRGGIEQWKSAKIFCVSFFFFLGNVQFKNHLCWFGSSVSAVDIIVAPRKFRLEGGEEKYNCA